VALAYHVCACVVFRTKLEHWAESWLLVTIRFNLLLSQFAH